MNGSLVKIDIPFLFLFILRKCTAHSNSQVISPLALTLKCLIVTWYLTVVSLIELINHTVTAVPKLQATRGPTNERPRTGDGKQVHRLRSARQLRELSSALRHTHLLCAGPPVHWSNQHKKKLQLHNYDYIYLSLIRAYNHFFPAWYSLFIFTFLVAPCCLFNQIDPSHTHSFQAGRASHWLPFL